MELLLLITICLLTGQTLGNDPVKMIFKAGDQDVLLSCSFKADLRYKKVKWIKDGKEIYVFGNGKVDPTKVDEHFRDRISHFQDGLQSGNASIKITKAKISDVGIYSCLFYDGVAEGGSWEIELTVGYVGIKEGEDAILPCHYGIDLRAMTIDWKKDGKDVLSFGKGFTNSSGRASYFPDQLQSGNASIKIKEAKVSDSGNYTCIRVDQTGKIKTKLHIKLVVACKLNSSANDCDKCKTPVSGTTKVKDGVQVDCEALGVSPESEMKLKNSANVTVDAPVSKTAHGNYYDITLQVVLTKEDHYHCVLKQGDICQPVNTLKVYVPSGAGYFLVPSSLLVFSLLLSLGF